VLTAVGLRPARVIGIIFIAHQVSVTWPKPISGAPGPRGGWVGGRSLGFGMGMPSVRASACEKQDETTL
jgi:hypothetical protein